MLFYHGEEILCNTCSLSQIEIFLKNFYFEIIFEAKNGIAILMSDHRFLFTEPTSPIPYIVLKEKENQQILSKNLVYPEIKN